MGEERKLRHNDEEGVDIIRHPNQKSKTVDNPMIFSLSYHDTGTGKKEKLTEFALLLHSLLFAAFLVHF